MDDFGITPIEWIFLGVAVVVTIPFGILIRYVWKEMKKEESQK